MYVNLLSMRRMAVASLMLPLLLASLLAGAACEVRCIHPAAHSCCPAMDGASHVAVSVAGAKECSHPMSVLPWELAVPMTLTAGFAALQPVESARVELRTELRGLPGTGPPIFPLRI